MQFKYLVSAAIALTMSTIAWAQGSEVNIYSARHYPTDEVLYANFTRATGIKINRVDADDAGIIARLKAEGAASPADVILMVDAARLWRGEADGLFLPIQSALLDAAIPATLRAQKNSQGATPWFGFSTRARIIVYNKITVNPQQIDTYEKLADPINKGKLCIRSGSHPYNLSLFGSVLEHLGEQDTKRWLQGLVTNMARSPKGGDTDQILGVASGECGVAVSNSYYLARLMRSDKPQDQAAMAKIGIVFPNQSSWGTHINMAGGAVAKHSHNTANAVRFLEYLASPAAQRHFADGNNEWPAVPSVSISNPALQAMSGGSFKSEAVHVRGIGMNQVKVQQLLDQTGFK